VGSGGYLSFDATKVHRFQAYDFPIDLYLHWEIKDETLFSVHQMADLYKKQGYFFEWDATENVQLSISRQSVVQWVHPSQPLHQIMKKGSYQLTMIDQSQQYDIESPYLGTFDTVLQEGYASYFLSTTDSDEMLRLGYVPLMVDKHWAVLRLRLHDFRQPQPVLSARFLLTNRSIKLRYFIQTRNPLEEPTFEFFDQLSEVNFEFLGKKELLNGQQAYVFDSKEDIPLQQIEQNGPYYMRIKEQRSQSFANSGYRLPEKIVLPMPDYAKIRADKGVYQCELFVNL
jgi:hypothetical protein